MKGFGDQTKSKKKLNNFRIKQYHKQIMNEAVKLHSAGNFSEAKKYYHKLIQEGVEAVSYTHLTLPTKRIV